MKLSLLVVPALIIGGAALQQTQAQPLADSLGRTGEFESSSWDTGLWQEPDYHLQGTSETTLAMPLLELTKPDAVNRIHLRATIDKILQERGAYGSGLDEAYGEYAKFYFDSGNFHQAAQLFRQAWHVSRVNSGLYSEPQLDYINLLIEVLVELRQWGEVHNLHQLGFHIASRVYPPEDIRYIIAAEFYTSWQVEALSKRIVLAGHGSIFETAQHLSAFYEEVIDKVEHANGGHTGRLIKLVLGKAQTDMTIAQALVRTQFGISKVGPVNYVPETECFDADFARSKSSRYCLQVRLTSNSYINDARPTFHFVLGRYLRQIDHSIARLERISISEVHLDSSEKIWIDTLINTLSKESESVFNSVRLKRSQ